MQKLQLPDYTFRIGEKNGKPLIYDEFRHRWVILSPEEWVRQNFLKFLTGEKKYPPSLIAIEKKVLINDLPQRFDLLVYDRRGNPLLVAEFKAPRVVISQETFDQAIRYNSVLQAPYFLISNGLTHFICRIDFHNHTSVYIPEIPMYDEMTRS